MSLALLLLNIPDALSAQSLIGEAVAASFSNAPTPARSQQSGDTRIISGVVLSTQNELVAGVTVLARSATGEQRTTSDAEGNFRLSMPDGAVTLNFFGRGIALVSKTIAAGEPTQELLDKEMVKVLT
jgi:hypothetical protein